MFLIFQRSRPKSVELNATTFDLAELVQEVVATVGPIAQQKENDLAFKVLGNLGAATTDATKLRQILLNLIGNAAKFTEAGKITITAVRTELASVGWVEFRI